MEPFYIAVFGVLAAIAAGLELTKGKSTSTDNTSKEFSRFRSNYVLVYSLMMGAFLWKPSWNRVGSVAVQFTCITFMQRASL